MKEREDFLDNPYYPGIPFYFRPNLLTSVISAPAGRSQPAPVDAKNQESGHQPQIRNATPELRNYDPSSKPYIERSLGQRIAAAISPYARPVFEIGGGTLGALLGAGSGLLAGAPTVIGAPVTSAAGSLVGGGLGYTEGRSVANALDEYAGTRTPPTLVNRLKETGEIS